jgi:hypothetical protein
VADVRSVEDGLREPPDRDHAAAAREAVQVREASPDFLARRPPVGIRTTGLVRMRRNDVPEQDVLRQSELGEHAVNDRRAGLRRSGAGELALRGERDAGDPRTEVAGSLADEQEGRVAAALEVRLQPLAP